MGNSLGRAPLGGSDPSETTVDGRETVGNSLGRALLRERRIRGDRVDERETVGKSLGRALLGGSNTSATTGWTDGKERGIAWGKLLWEGAALQRRQGGRTGKWQIAWGELG